MKRELKEFLIWYRSEPDIIRKALDVSSVVDLYEKFVDSHASEESRVVRENKELKEHCTQPNGQVGCVYKCTDLWACVARECGAVRCD